MTNIESKAIDLIERAKGNSLLRVCNYNLKYELASLTEGQSIYKAVFDMFEKEVIVYFFNDSNQEEFVKYERTTIVFIDQNIPANHMIDCLRDEFGRYKKEIVSRNFVEDFVDEVNERYNYNPLDDSGLSKEEIEKLKLKIRIDKLNSQLSIFISQPKVLAVLTDYEEVLALEGQRSALKKHSCPLKRIRQEKKICSRIKRHIRDAQNDSDINFAIRLSLKKDDLSLRLAALEELEEVKKLELEF